MPKCKGKRPVKETPPKKATSKSKAVKKPQRQPKNILLGPPSKRAFQVDNDLFLQYNLAMAPSEEHERITEICNLRWADPKVYNHFRTKPSRNMNVEKVVILDEARKQCKSVADEFDRRGWMGFCDPPGVYCEALVREFYSNLSILKKGKTKMEVRGQLVFFGKEAINKILRLTPPSSIKDYDTQFAMGDKSKIWYADIITKPKVVPTWKEPGVAVRRSQLSYEAKCWLTFISNRVRPSGNEGSITWKTGVLIASIMRKWDVDLGTIIFDMINERGHQIETNLPFPCLITRILNNAEVPRLPTDVDTESHGDVDIFRIHDDDNPNKKKLLIVAAPRAKKQRVEDDVSDESDESGSESEDDEETPVAPVPTAQSAPSSRKAYSPYQLPTVPAGHSGMLYIPDLMKKIGDFMGTMLRKFDDHIQSEPAMKITTGIKEHSDELKKITAVVESNTTQLKILTEAVNKFVLTGGKPSGLVPSVATVEVDGDATIEVNSDATVEVDGADARSVVDSTTD